jgi:manganese/zinc-transporting P-type ATPase C
MRQPRGCDCACACRRGLALASQRASKRFWGCLAAETLALIRSNFKASVGINSAIMAGAVLGRLSPVATAFLHNVAAIGILLRALSSDAEEHKRLAAPRRLEESMS